MDSISERVLRTLEYGKVLLLIAEGTGSVLGREEILALRPSTDLEEIQRLLRPVLETIDLLLFDDPLPLGNVPDIRKSLKTARVPGTSLGVRELVEVGQAISVCGRIEAYFADRREKYPNLVDLIGQIQAYPAVREALHQALDPDGESVRDSASRKLRRIRRAMDQVQSGIREHVASVLAKIPDNVVQDRIITLRAGRFVIPIRENQKHRVEGIVHDQSSSGATLFIEPMATVDLNNRLRQLALAEEQEIKRILKELTARVAEISENLDVDLHLLGRLDAIVAKASFSKTIEATEPVFNDEGRIRLNKGRHPILLQRLNSEDKSEELIPLDLVLGTEEFWALVLTGPNAGGKTVALKTVGLLSLMAQAGLPIPAGPKSEFPVFRSIFADIGDAQSIEDDLSTFSSHVANLSEICRDADRDSLVLMDEVGSSTDPDQGSALAMALIGALTQRGCRTIATTHHGALKAFAHSTPGVSNGSMAFDSTSLKPTFQLRLKIPGSSYAFEIARRLDMSDEIVDEAERIAGSDVGRVESLIAELDETYRAYLEESEKAATEHREMVRLREDYEARLKDLEKRERAFKRTAQQEASRILDDANALIERTVREIREKEADKSSIRSAHDAVGSARKQLEKALKSEPQERDGEDLQPGDRVWVRAFEKMGVVVHARNGAVRALVEVENVRVEVPMEDLEPCADDSPAPKRATRSGYSARSDISSEIDLRGFTAEEAIDAVDKYLDDLYLSRMESARLIHGKGTGALRTKIGVYLKMHERVKSQRLGNLEEGGSGVTVVTLETED